MDTDAIDWKYREPTVAVEVTEPLARILRESRAGLTYRWLERIEDRIELEENQVFPSEEILDHVPLLIEAVADFMEDPAEEGPAADEVMAKAAELGEMRFQQGFSTYQVLKEFEILGGVILAFLRSRLSSLGFAPEPDHVLILAHRVYRALAKIQQATAARHIALLEERRADLDRRLRLIATVVDTLDAGPEEDGQDRLAHRLKTLRRLADAGPPSRHRGLPLQGTVREAVRRVRPIAAEAGLDIRIEKPLPDTSVPGAEVEHCLVAYLTNALRHCHESAGECYVSVAARSGDDELVITVRNTGRVVEATDDITELAPTEQDGEEPGPGVGLRFVQELARSLRGRTWVEPAQDPAGAIFALALPARRWDDAGEAPDDAGEAPDDAG